MIHPPLDNLLKHTENKYTLVIVAAKRARQILQEEQSDDERINKAVTIALEEVINGKTKYQRTKNGIK